MSIKVKMGKHEFEVKADVNSLIEEAKALEVFKPNTYCEFEGGEDELLTEEEFNANVEYFINKIKMVCEEDYLISVVNSMPKKKNGTFYKGRKTVVTYYGNTIFFTEWHNTWATYELRFSAVSDLVLELQIVRYNHTPA